MAFSFTADQANRANYACAALSLVILLTRATVSRRCRRPIDLSFYLVLASVVVIATRICIVYFYLQFGTASDAIANAHYFDTHDYSTIKKGSMLSLVARVLITATCWLQICLLLLFYSSIMDSIRWVFHMVNITWAVTGASFVAVVLATFLECRPLNLYWQVDPNPGKCVKGYIQLLVQCISNIVIDVMLLAISWPILFCKGRLWAQHLRVGVVFFLGTFCIIVTTLRLVSIYDTGSAQPTRSLWASVQMIVSTFVANAPTIYGDMQVAKRKKSDPIVRRASRAEVWQSDREALARFPDPEMPLPERAVTVSSTSSGGRKEWFDHLEDIEDIK